ncbi:MAG: CoB--CoM heterodisulfide reductase iron-sulfur subunit A family protein [Syntrophales bacterium]|nr:CoB--CoM heterodisulfide reductase iron-sulfur subunit A family protein [Syntrophales bacterium]MDD5642257.1 CoB--CoM heterodisulfide reductase iron-sulfur subunit A family protein [Syntrophales bacterium]
MAEKKKPDSANGGKVGVYVCHCGGNISDAVDVEKVCEQARQVPGVVVARANMFMCSDPGQEMIIEDLKSGLVDKVVVASCSPSLHETTFRNVMTRAGANPYVYEQANLREQVSWVHHGPEATAKASRLVAAAAAKAGKLKPLDPIRVEVQGRAVVIGGGVAGLKSALELAERGLSVILLEKSPFLGGQVAQLSRLAPVGETAGAIIGELADAVLKHPAITVHTCVQVEAFEGYIGNFKLRVVRRAPAGEAYADQLARLSRSGLGLGEFVPFVGVMPALIPESPEEVDLEAGVIVLATGMRPYQPRQGEYGYKKFPQVVTLPEFNRLLAAAAVEGDTLVLEGRPIRRAALIHCVGSRQIPGVHEENPGGYLNEYCSRTCCGATLYAANFIRENYPQTRVFDFYRDIRAYGRGQEELYTQAAANQTVFFRFEAGEEPQVMQNPDPKGPPLLVQVKDVLTFGEELAVPVDLVVLAVGQEPNNIGGLVEKMKIPVGADRFLQEVHPKLRPVEVSVAGIFLAGTCQAPFDVGESCAAAGAAAVKAAAILTQGYVELDPFVAEVDLSKCKGTGKCVEACLADGALEMVEMEVDGQKVQRARVNPVLCIGCGACVAVCPENAINVQGWTLKQFESMVDMIVSDEYLEGA